MDKAFLKRCLAQDMSLPEIGRLTNRPPGTVGYWVAKHELVANGADQFSRKGPIAREELEARLERGDTLDEIASAMNVTVARVRYAISKYQLTGSKRRRIDAIHRAREAGESAVMLDCPEHGRTAFWVGASTVRCKRCNTNAVSRRRRRMKKILVAEAGGACTLCGYDRSTAALQFHHLDPAAKSFAVSNAGVTRSIDVVRSEAEKCILLCANCHAEVESGVTKFDRPASSAVPTPRPGLEPGNRH